MHVVSVNVGLPREVEWKGRKVLTGIFKSPVHARVPVRRLNIDGDGQADLTVHGGPVQLFAAGIRTWPRTLVMVAKPMIVNFAT